MSVFRQTFVYLLIHEPATGRRNFENATACEMSMEITLHYKVAKL
jgi:hypothetical protein